MWQNMATEKPSSKWRYGEAGTPGTAPGRMEEARRLVFDSDEEAVVLQLQLSSVESAQTWK